VVGVAPTKGWGRGFESPIWLFFWVRDICQRWLGHHGTASGPWGCWASVALAAHAALPARAARLGQHGAVGAYGVGPTWRWRSWGEVASKGEVAWAQARSPNHQFSKTIYKNKILRLHAKKRASLVVTCPLSLPWGLRFNSWLSSFF
jgi:hypothetical protein